MTLTPTPSESLVAPIQELAEFRLAEELCRAREELAAAELAEWLREGAPELLEARALRAANGVIAARLALLRLQSRRGRPLSVRDRERMEADAAILALAPHGTLPRRPQAE